jgi:superfamily I DNA/RNA helicase
MPTLIMTNFEKSIDGSVKAKAMTFLEKLCEDDTVPGLHIEPMKGAVDPRVRTGRVDQFWRAIVFRLDHNGERYYVFRGVWPHDEANKIAQQVALRVNPVNGLPEFDETPPPGPDLHPTQAAVQPSSPKADEPEPLLITWGVTRHELVDTLGMPDKVADEAFGVRDEDELLALAQRHEGWLGLILVDLATGDSVESIVEKLQLARPSATEGAADLIESFQQPAARAQFAFIDGQEELRRVIEAGDFGAWRIFLHPEQRKYVERSYSGPFRLSGGAGTGKTVVLIHRARRLAQDEPKSRIVLTTFTTNLAESLRDALSELDPALGKGTGLGKAGVHVAGIDSLVAAVIRSAQSTIDPAVEAVLGEPRASAAGRTPGGRWRAVVDSVKTSLASEIANETFLASEYELVILPNRIRTEAEYLRVRRPGRGVALDRAKRSAVWAFVEAYRAQSRIDGSLDFAEAAAVAAAHLDANPAERPADHVLVDEAQDLTPSQLQFVRSLVVDGKDDLFLAEDSHQRIYGPRVVLKRYGINIVGRSQRLTLNYRTTAQNLRYAMTVLDGGDYTDLENEPEATDYRSARTGPDPEIDYVTGLDAELDAIVKRAKAWVGADTNPGTIAILVPDRYQRDRVTNRLAESGIPARAVDREAPSDRVVVMTMHRAKGTEFSKVIITDVGFRSSADTSRLEAMDPSERADAELRRRSLEYVAATRARDELVVLRRS